MCGTTQNEERYGTPFTTGDVVGCGWNRHTHTVFFTKNGIMQGNYDD
jgi:hypothetical protein